MRQRELKKLKAMVAKLAFAKREELRDELTAEDGSATSVGIIEARGKADLVTALKPLLPADTIVCTNGSSVLPAAVKEIGVTHRPVNASAGRRVVASVYRIQIVNAFDSRLKSRIRRFHGVATKYLDSYLGWFRKLDRSPTTGWQSASLLALALYGRNVIN